MTNSIEPRRAKSIVGIIAILALCVAPCSAANPDVAEDLKAAAGGAGEARYTAIDDLGEEHAYASSVVPELQKLLGDKDQQVRWRSARALGDYGSLAKGAAGDLRKLLAESDPAVQYHAAVALGKVGDQSDDTVKSLVAAATSKDGRVARAAIAALRNLQPGPERVMAALDAALKSDDQAVVVHALEALVERGGEAAPILNEALKRPNTVYLACSAIEQIGPDAAATVPALTEVLRSTKHSHLLIQALLALASIGLAAESAAPQIVPLLETTNDATVPVAAAYALGSIGAKSSAGDLRRALEKDNAFLQMIAAWSLAKLNPDDQVALRLAVDKLAQGLKSSDAAIQTAAAKCLQMLQAPPEMVAPVLVAVANDEDPEVRDNVVEAIASLGESVVPRAAAALTNPELQSPAVRVLTRLGPKAAGAVQPLMAAAANASPAFRSEINLALAAIGPAAAPASEMLAQSVADGDAAVRESALYALREIGPAAKAAQPALVKRMQADNSFDAMASAWALSKIAPADSAIAAQAVAKLTAGLADESDQVRMESAEAIAAWASAARPTVPTLKKMAEEDSSAEVRAAAQAALDEIAKQP